MKMTLTSEKKRKRDLHGSSMSPKRAGIDSEKHSGRRRDSVESNERMIKCVPKH
jgi:hypothetical protein